MNARIECGEMRRRCLRVRTAPSWFYKTFTRIRPEKRIEMQIAANRRRDENPRVRISDPGPRTQSSILNRFSSMIFRIVRSVSIMPWVLRVPIFRMVCSGEAPMMPSVG